MNKHIAIICTLLQVLLPILFVYNRESATMADYLLCAVLPMLAICIFLLNYYKLVPDALRKGRRSRLVVANMLIIVCCTAILMGKHTLEGRRIHHERMQREAAALVADGKHEPGLRQMPARDAHDGRQLSQAEELENGKTPRPDGRGMHVIGVIFDSIFLMIAIFIAYSLRSNQQIVLLKQKQQEAEVARQQAELRGLRNQISPHFLLNTLNNIYALAAISSERTQDAVMQLSKMLRHMLYDNQADMVTLRSEADFLCSYVELMKLRMASNVTINNNIVVDQQSLTMVAPLLFISLIENAFKHGVASQVACQINLDLHEDDEKIVCHISNSNNPKQANDRSGHGIGLILVQQRLDNVYAGRYEWTYGVEADGLYHSMIVLRK